MSVFTPTAKFLVSIAQLLDLSIVQFIFRQREALDMTEDAVAEKKGQRCADVVDACS